MRSPPATYLICFPNGGVSLDGFSSKWIVSCLSEQISAFDDFLLLLIFVRLRVDQWIILSLSLSLVPLHKCIKPDAPFCEPIQITKESWKLPAMTLHCSSRSAPWSNSSSSDQNDDNPPLEAARWSSVSPLLIKSDRMNLS